MTQIHTLNLCLIQRPSANTASRSTNQPNATHTPSAKHPASRLPRQPANWPVGQRFANCLSTCCQHFANMLPNFCQAAVSTQVHQCFCALYFGCFFWMTENPLFVFNFGLDKLDGKWPRLHKPGVKGKNKRKKRKNKGFPKQRKHRKTTPPPTLSLPLPTKNAPSGQPTPRQRSTS